MILKWVAAFTLFFAQADMAELTSEMTRHAVKESVTATALYYPPEFFGQILREKERFTEAEIREAVSLFRRYPLVSLLVGRHEPGLTRYLTPQAMQGAISVVAAGTRWKPLAHESLPPQLRTFLSSLRPQLATSIGPAGRNLGFFCFAPEAPMARPSPGFPSGSLKLVLRGQGRETLEFSWTLPLPSITPTAPCSHCHARTKPGWKFCPFDGKELPE